MGKVLKYAALATVMLASANHAFADASQQPLVMRLHTNIYGYQGPTNSFTIYLGSTQNSTEFYVKGPKTQQSVYVDPWSVGQGSDGSGTTIATPINLSVTETNGTIEIYGDAAKLDFIDVHGCYINSIELADEMINLSVVDLSHNELSAVDLSKQINLASIDLTDNSFTVGSNMKIGTNHPNLQLLSVGINDAIDPELNLRNFPNLQYFSARNNYGLTSVDPTDCPKLVSLVLEVTNINTIDVSQNKNLRVLNLSNTKVTDIDISQNTALTEFYASHQGSYNVINDYKLTSVDLSANRALTHLDLSGNLLTSVDLTHNPNLVMLYLQRNYLTEIDLSMNTRLSTVDLSNNYFNFVTLPMLPGVDYTYYQRPLPVDLKYKVNEPIDFSSQVIRPPYTQGKNTITPETYAQVVATPRAQEEYVVAPSKYTYENGVITFKEALPDSVYVQFHCTAFDEWDLKTAPFMVKTAEAYDLPSTAFSFTPALSMAGRQVSFKLAAASTHPSVTLPQNVIVSINGVNTVLENAISSAVLPSENNISFTVPASVSKVDINLPDGLAATQLEMDGIALSSIDLSPSESLLNLKLTNTGLNKIDLSYNRSLVALDLSGNNLSSLDLTGVRGDYEKWDLGVVNLSNNKLRSFNMVYYESVQDLDLSGNQFDDFNFGYFTNLTNLNFSNNNLSGEVLLDKIEGLVTLDMSGNNITGITCGNWNSLRTVDLSDNSLSFATLPVLGNGVNYTYTPQSKLQILTSASVIDLSAQNVNNNTTYTWKFADSNEVLPASSYTCENGSTKFDESLVGQSVYCELTNPAFPAFNSNPLTTTATKVADVPSVLVASFTVDSSSYAQIGFRFHSSGDNAVYIDWNGDGSELEPFIYEANSAGGIYRECKPVAGRTAKVYSYDDASNISVFASMGITMSNFDGSPMTGLTAVNIHGAGLQDGQIHLAPEAPIYEIVLDGNKFKTESFGQYPVSNLNLANNKYESIDLSVYPDLRFAQLADNVNNTSVKLNNRNLMQLDMTNNSLSEIDLNGLPGLQELLLGDNKLHEIDITPVKNNLRALYLAGNYFTFATLPLPSDLNLEVSTAYSYANQKPIDVECENGRIDLTDQSMVAGTPTEYRWFLGNYQGDVYYDYYYEDFVGQMLEGPDASSDPDFVVENGVTTFLRNQSMKVIGAMTNAELPNLILFTTPTAINKHQAGVEMKPEDAFGEIVDVVNLSGAVVRRQVPVREALQDLEPGIYIIGGKKVLVK